MGGRVVWSPDRPQDLVFNLTSLYAVRKWAWVDFGEGDSVAEYPTNKS